jgi:hypothetical protein
MNTFIAFYVKSGKPILHENEINEIGYTEYRIYTNGPRYKTNLRGFCGNKIVVTLSNGKKIRTNDLWSTPKWLKDVPEHEITGTCEFNETVKVDETYIYI